MNYTQKKLWEAVHFLVTGAGPIRERLAGAAQDLYLLHNVTRSEERAFPQHPRLQERFDRVMGRLTLMPAVGAGSAFEASARALTDQEAKDTAEEIFALFCKATDLADTPVGFEPRHGGTR